MKKRPKKKQAKISIDEEIEPLRLASAEHLKKFWDSEDEEKVWSKYY